MRHSLVIENIFIYSLNTFVRIYEKVTDYDILFYVTSRRSILRYVIFSYGNLHYNMLVLVMFH